MRQAFGTREPKTTWALLPWEEACKPGLVTVTNESGELVAVIDPVTRVRKNVSGREAVLTPQGWSLSGKQLQRIGFTPKTDKTMPDRLPRTRHGRMLDRDRR